MSPLDRREMFQAASAFAALLAAGPAAAQFKPAGGAGGGGGMNAIFGTPALDPQAGLSAVLLGTGSPIPSPDRACASTLIIAGDRTFLVDTGRGFLGRLADTGLNRVPVVFYTHFHSDHFGELGEFMVNRAIAGAETPVKVIGPEGAKQVVASVVAAYALDNKYRQTHHGDKWSEAAMTAEVLEKGPGVVFEEGGLTVTMIEVDHPPVKPAMGYRFDYQGKAIVVSGDTKKCAGLARAAKGADVLIHEVVHKKLVEKAIALLRRDGGPASERGAKLGEEMMTYHTSPEEAAQVAAEAGVKKLVFTHLVPSLPPNPATDALFTQGLRSIFKGPIEVGRDGMELKIS